MIKKIIRALSRLVRAILCLWIVLASVKGCLTIAPRSEGDQSDTNTIAVIFGIAVGALIAAWVVHVSEDFFDRHL